MSLECRTHSSAREDAALVDADRYTYSVMHKILCQPCEKIVTDHERLVICYSGAPYPVWVWMPDDADSGELARAWQAMREAFPQGYRFIVKEQLAEYILREEPGMGETMRMFAYGCPEVIAPVKAAPGEYRAAQRSDAALAAAWIGAFHVESGVDVQDEQAYRAEAEQMIGLKRLFLWEDEQGTPCAMCGVRQDGDCASITHVYTPEASRRRGYAANLVYRVTRAILAQGMTAMLYTDAGYTASNACYTQIGYVKMGGLCTIGERAAQAGDAGA